MSTCPNHTGDLPVPSTHRVEIPGYYQPSGTPWYAEFCEPCARWSVKAWTQNGYRALCTPIRDLPERH